MALLASTITLEIFLVVLLSYFLAAITLVNQLDPEELNWEIFSCSLMIQDAEASENLIHLGRALTAPVNLFDGTVSRTAYSRIVSKFLTRGGPLGEFLDVCGAGNASIKDFA